MNNVFSNSDINYYDNDYTTSTTDINTTTTNNNNDLVWWRCHRVPPSKIDHIHTHTHTHIKNACPVVKGLNQIDVFQVLCKHVETKSERPPPNRQNIPTAKTTAKYLKPL